MRSGCELTAGVAGIKVFGIGLNKTGTTSLGRCYEILGLRHKSFDPDLTIAFGEGKIDDVLAVARDYDGMEDWPWPLVFREAAAAYPDAVFVLTTRSSPEVWFGSLMAHSERTGPTIYRKIAYGHEMPHEHKDEHIARYTAHNDAVRAYFANAPHRLLEVCWEHGDGWAELCAFLGTPVPKLPFPHLNARPAS